MLAVKGSLDERGKLKLQEGQFFLHERASGPIWVVRPPRSGSHDLDSRWTVTENGDGSITVTPLIDTGQWHGLLTGGEWVELPRPFIDENMVRGPVDMSKFTTPVPLPADLAGVLVTEEMLEQGISSLRVSGLLHPKATEEELRTLALDIYATMVKISHGNI